MRKLVTVVAVSFLLSWQALSANESTGDVDDYSLQKFLSANLYASNEEKIQMCKDLPTQTMNGFALQLAVVTCKGFMSDARYSWLKQFADIRSKIENDLQESISNSLR